MKSNFLKIFAASIVCMTISTQAFAAESCLDPSMKKVESKLAMQIALNQLELSDLEKNSQFVDRQLSGQKWIARASTFSGAVGVTAAAIAAWYFSLNLLEAGVTIDGSLTLARLYRIGRGWSEFGVDKFGHFLPKLAALETLIYGGTATALSPAGWAALWLTDKKSGADSIRPKTDYRLSDSQILALQGHDHSGSPAHAWEAIIGSQDLAMQKASNDLVAQTEKVTAELKGRKGFRASIDRILGRSGVKEIEIIGALQKGSVALEKEKLKFLRAMLSNVRRSCALTDRGADVAARSSAVFSGNSRKLTWTYAAAGAKAGSAFNLAK